MNAPAPGPVQLAPAAEAIWENAKSLIQQIPAVRDEILSLWDDCATLLDRGLSGPGHPQRKAIYTAIEGMQMEFMSRAAALLRVPGEIDARNRTVDAGGKRKEFESAMRAANPAAVMILLSPEVKQALDRDARAIDEYVPKAQIEEAAALIAAASPFLAARQIFAAYLNKPTAGATALEMTIALVKNVGIDFLAKANPVIGPALALAEAIKAHTERRERELKAAVEEMDRLFVLQDALKENLDALTAAEQHIHAYNQSAQQLDAKVDVAFRQAIGVAHVLEKGPQASA
jgi:hypothetical protein